MSKPSATFIRRSDLEVAKANAKYPVIGILAVKNREDVYLFVMKVPNYVNLNDIHQLFANVTPTPPSPRDRAITIATSHEDIPVSSKGELVAIAPAIYFRPEPVEVATNVAPLPARTSGDEYVHAGVTAPDYDVPFTQPKLPDPVVSHILASSNVTDFPSPDFLENGKTLP